MRPYVPRKGSILSDVVPGIAKVLTALTWGRQATNDRRKPSCAEASSASRQYDHMNSAIPLHSIAGVGLASPI